ncbi:MAG: L-histidine N(alpha)-methyltransferase [Synechococcaceae cyanobacterium]|nr:L-histidine N(alpha)-methyltransferase [Synechococcaceae cyanobacterium]
MTPAPAPPTPGPTLLDLHPAPAALAQLVIAGMQRRPRQLPAWLLYDDEGSRLFELICQQPEYTLTATETALLEAEASAIAARLGPGTLVEFGAGSARKVGPLLRALAAEGCPSTARCGYVALDISAEHLRQALQRLSLQHPCQPLLGICCDYSVLEALPDHPLLEAPRLGFYPGSSIGNFEPQEAEQLLARMRVLLGPGGKLLVGLDQPRSRERLEAAYNDRAGVSAAFALNLLTRLNRDLDGDFQPQRFSYRAWWEPVHSRIAMALISRCDQTVSLAGRRWSFAAAEPLITEYSVKYDRASFAALAERAGWRCAERWSDPAGEVALQLLVQADSAQMPAAG